MDTWLLVLIIVVAALVVIGLVAWSTMQARRRKELQGRFGSEYDRTLEEADNRRAAERELRERADKRDRLDIRPLSAASRERYLGEWRTVQAHFVDDPAIAVNEADALIAMVMRERGYPVDDFDTRAEMVSTDAPDVVENYRAGHEVWKRHRQARASTEDLREAMIRYRSVFDELVGSTEDAAAVEGEGRLRMMDVEPGQVRER